MDIVPKDIQMDVGAFIIYKKCSWIVTIIDHLSKSIMRISIKPIIPVQELLIVLITNSQFILVILSTYRLSYTLFVHRF